MSDSNYIYSPYRSIYTDSSAYSRDKLNDIFDSLPEDLKDAISSVESADVIAETGKIHSLHIDQIAILGQEAGLFLLGVTDPTEFVNILSNKLGVDKNMASQIAGDINEKIFVKVKDSLRSLNHESGIRNQEFTNKLNQENTTKTPNPATENLIKNVETEKLNIPKKTKDILFGKTPEEKKESVDVLGFEKPNAQSIPNDRQATSPWTENKNPETFAQKPKTMGEMNILDDKMNKGVNVEGEEIEVAEKKTIGKVIDPYKEAV